MATSSIFDTIKVRSPEEAERVIEAMERAYKIAQRADDSSLAMQVNAQEMSDAEIDNLFKENKLFVTQ